jgi:hypothetical protein|tara:strand:+ start:296 stop:445 length:150 start_codon:yes stop_codon:yes gene_type:complete
VAGGNRNAGKSSEMNFDCSESYWPDAKNGAGLFYKWTVVKVVKVGTLSI